MPLKKLQFYVISIMKLIDLIIGQPGQPVDVDLTGDDSDIEIIEDQTNVKPQVIDLTQEECGDLDGPLLLPMICYKGQDSYLTAYDRRLGMTVSCKLVGSLAKECPTRILEEVNNRDPWKSCTKDWMAQNVDNLKMCRLASGALAVFDKLDPSQACPSPKTIPACKDGTTLADALAHDGGSATGSDIADPDVLILECRNVNDQYQLCGKSEDDAESSMILRDKQGKQGCEVPQKHRAAVQDCSEDYLEQYIQFLDNKRQPGGPGSTFTCPVNPKDLPTTEVEIEKIKYESCKVLDDPDVRNFFFRCLPESAQDQGYMTCRDEAWGADMLYFYSKSNNYLCLISELYHTVAQNCPAGELQTAITKGDPTSNCGDSSTSSGSFSKQLKLCPTSAGGWVEEDMGNCQEPRPSTSKKVPTCTASNLKGAPKKRYLEGQVATVGGEMPEESTNAYIRMKFKYQRLLTSSTPANSSVDKLDLRPRPNQERSKRNLVHLLDHLKLAPKLIKKRQATIGGGVVAEFLVAVPSIDKFGENFGATQLVNNLKKNAGSFDAGEEYKIDVDSIKVREVSAPRATKSSSNVFHPLPVMAAAGISAFLLIGFIIVYLKCSKSQGLASRQKDQKQSIPRAGAAAHFTHPGSYDPEDNYYKSVPNTIRHSEDHHYKSVPNTIRHSHSSNHQLFSSNQRSAEKQYYKQMRAGQSSTVLPKQIRMTVS